MITEKQLTQLKKEIDTAKNTQAELNGQLSMLKRQLKQEFDCDDLDELEDKLEGLKQELLRITDKITAQTEDLEERYTFE